MKKILFCIALCLVGIGQLPGQVSSDSVARMLFAAEALSGEEKIDQLGAVVRLAREIGDVTGQMNAYRALSVAHRDEKDISGELRARLSLLNLQDIHKDSLTRARGWYSLGIWYLEQSILGKAEEVFGKAANLALGHDDDLYFRCLRERGFARYQKGALADARTTYLKALSTPAGKNNLSEQLWIRQQLARIAHQFSNHQQELEISEEVRGLANSLGLRRVAIAAVNNMGYANLFLNRPDSAATLFQEALDSLARYPDAGMELDARLNLGVIQHNQNQLPEAIDNLELVVASSKTIGRYKEMAEALDYLARIYLRRNDAYNALAYNDKAIEVAKREELAEALMTSYNTRSKIQESLFEFEAVLEAREKYLHIRDSLELANQIREQETLQEQLLAERMEKELKLIWVNEELKETEIQRLNALRDRDAEEKMRLEKESEIKSVQLRNKDLAAGQIRDSLALSEQRRRVEQQQSDIRNLDNLRRIQELQLQEERLVAQEKTNEVNLLEKENQIQSLENKQQQLENASQKASIRNLFYLVLGLGLLLLLILLGLWVLRRKNTKIQRQQVLIAAEKEKSDQLLLNILPVQVAEELKEKGHSRPRNYESVSVVFTDFSGFTMISEKLSAGELVEKLDAIFLEFDRISEEHGLQRIKTIGDAYMAACGLPDPDPDHARKAVEAALAMRNFIRGFNQKLPLGEPHWNIRIGVHSGPVVAGVVGIRKFAYDIWGDTVNTASRMESSGEVGKVNVSGATHQLVKDLFAAEYRGKVYAKNKGEIDMFFLEQQKVPS